MRRFLLVITLCILSGCSNRYYDWASSNFEQVTMRSCSHALTSYVQSEDRYDTFNIVGHYDILWYSLPVLEWHMNSLVDRASLIPEHIQKLANELYDVQKHSLVFYLLMSDDTEGSLRPQLSVTDQERSKWSISLVVGTKSYEPVSIRRVIVPTEITCLFGNRFDPHYRFSYKIVFARYDEDDDLLEINPIHITLKSVQYTVDFEWDEACIAQHCKERAWLSNLQ